MEINPKVYDLYFGELFCQTLEELNESESPRHFHAQCQCDACMLWDDRNCGCKACRDKFQFLQNFCGRKNNEFEMVGNTEHMQKICEYYKCITSRKPFTFESILLEDIDAISIKIESQPWQYCDVESCRDKLTFEKIFYRRLDGNLKMKDIYELRDTIMRCQVPSIYPEKHKMNTIFPLHDGNSLEVDAHVKDRILHVRILTSSEDGHIGCEHTSSSDEDDSDCELFTTQSLDEEISDGDNVVDLFLKWKKELCSERYSDQISFSKKKKKLNKISEI